jgi:hypothetical protein
MRSLLPVPQILAVSGSLLVANSLLHAQPPQAATPPAPAAGRAGPMQLTSATPLAGTENLDVYPAAPEGFNVARENIPHGEVKVVEYDSKTLGLRRMLRVYTPPGYTPDRKYPVLYLQHGLGNTSTEWTQRARAPIILDNLLADKKSSSRSSSPFPAAMRPRQWPTRNRGPYPGVLRGAVSRGPAEGNHPLRRVPLFRVHGSRPPRDCGDVDGQRPDLEHWPHQPRQVRVDCLRRRRSEHAAGGRTHSGSRRPQAAQAAVALRRQSGQPVSRQQGGARLPDGKGRASHLARGHQWSRHRRHEPQPVPLRAETLQGRDSVGRRGRR